MTNKISGTTSRVMYQPVRGRLQNPIREILFIFLL